MDRLVRLKFFILGGGLGRSALGLADNMSGWCYLSVRMFCYCAETEIESCQCFLFISSWVVAQVILGSVWLLLGSRQELLLLRRCQLVLRYFVRSLEDRGLCRIGLST